MPSIKPNDRLVQIKGRPGTYFRLQKSGGSNSRFQRVDLGASEYRLDGSFLVENSKLTKHTTYSEYLVDDVSPIGSSGVEHTEGCLDTVNIADENSPTAGVSITVDTEVYTKLKSVMTRLACNTPNAALRKLFKFGEQ